MEELKLEGLLMIERKNAEATESTQKSLKERALRKEKARLKRKAIKVLLFGVETILGTIGLYAVLVLGSLL